MFKNGSGPMLILGASCWLVAAVVYGVHASDLCFGIPSPLSAMSFALAVTIEREA